jgi:hypothetical protein
MNEYTPMEAIRMLSGIFEDDHEKMQTRLFLCCLIARNTMGDAADDFVDKQLAIVGIKLKRQPPKICECSPPSDNVDINGHERQPRNLVETRLGNQTTYFLG